MSHVTSTRLQIPFYQKILHIFLLSGFVFAQPLLDLIGSNTEFLVAGKAGRQEVYLLLSVLCFLIPGLIVLLESIARVFGQKRSATVHLGLTFVLSSALCLVSLNLLWETPGVVSIAVAVSAGATATYCYWRYPVTRVYLNFLSPAVLVIPIYFLLNPQVAKLISPAPASGQRPGFDIATSTPVVLLVFDEFPVITLLDENSEIDPVRYPNFARLAADATWFRNAQTVSGETEAAVPAILSGLLPKPGALPIPEDYPDTLFTLFAGSHKLDVFETITSLCPQLSCGGDIIGPADEVRQTSLPGFFNDIFIVYLHLIVPKDLAGDLPAISQTWKDFDQRQPTQAASSKRRTYTEVSRPEEFAIFLDHMSDSEKPGFYFYHALLPHVPWRFFPSGMAYKRYNIIDIPGLDLLKEQWGDNDGLVTLGQQRHLLQAGYTDKLVGDLIDRLKSQRIYDKSLVIVTADHGVSFWPNSSRRARGYTRPGTELDVLGIPLVVKMPHQQRGEINDAPIRTIDLVPTIGQILGIEIPWKTDGHAVTAPGRAAQGQPGVELPYSDNVSLQRKIDIFGTGTTRPDGLYDIGPHHELIGRRIEDLDRQDNSGMSVSIDQAEDLSSVDLNGSYVPAYITGNIETGDAGLDAAPLAVAVNGVISAVTTSYLDGENMRFAVIIPERSLAAGSNQLDIYSITEDEGGFLLTELVQ